MKITKKMMAAALALALALCMAGCELPMMGFDDYDVSSYIQALLDSSYHNSHDKFVSITQVPIENAQDNNLSTVQNAAINFCNIYGVSPNDQQLAALEQVMAQALAQAKYLVKEEKKVNGGYYIEVEVTPITNFRGLSQQIAQLRTQAQEEAAQANRAAMATPVPTVSPEGEDGDGWEDWDEGEEEPTPSPTPTPEPSPAVQVDPGQLFVEKTIALCQGQLSNITFDTQNIIIALDIRQTAQGALQLDMNQLDTIDKTVLLFQ